MRGCLLIAYCVFVSAMSKNVALNKPARQSSLYKNRGTLGAADLAVDGDTSQDFYKESCSSTDLQFNPYWEVDLGEIYLIHEILIYPRLDCCEERTRDVLIEPSINNTSFYAACFNSGVLPSFYTCKPENSNLGRWVKVSLTNMTQKAPLQLCEVEFMSKEALERGEFKLVGDVKGSGSAIQRVSARSRIECACICGSNKKCTSLNMIEDNLSSTGIICELLQSDVTSEDPDDKVSFWTRAN